MRSLKGRIPLKDFDVLGFTLNYELNVFNLLHILKLSGIPLLSAERRGFPLVMVGGIANPEFVADFADVVFIGEAEKSLRHITEVLKKDLRKSSKEELLLRLSQIEGVYIPSFYQPLYQGGRFKGLERSARYVPSSIKKAAVQDLDNCFFPEDWLVPYIEIVHDRISLEIMRGCPHRCKFCQARSQYFPWRLRSKEKIIDLASRLFRATGYEEIALLSLSSGDHPCIEQIIDSLTDMFKDKGVSISLPSLRVSQILGSLGKKISRIKRTSLTLAPETCSLRLAKLIDKVIPLGQIREVLRFALDYRYRTLKLYFILGLPQEEDDDLIQTLDFIVSLGRLIKGKNFKLHLSFSNFIPKPFTPLENVSLDSIDSLLRKHHFFKNNLKVFKNIVWDFHNPYKSFWEAFLSRSDRRVAPFLVEVYANKGPLRNFSFTLQEHKDLLSVCKKHSLPPEEYIQSKSQGDSLPWSHVIFAPH